MKKPERTTITHFFAPGLALAPRGGDLAGRSRARRRWTTSSGSSARPERCLSSRTTSSASCWTASSTTGATMRPISCAHATASQIDKVTEEFVGGRPLLCVEHGQRQSYHHRDQHPPDGGRRPLQTGSHLPLGGPMAHETARSPKWTFLRRSRRRCRDRMLGILFSQSFDIVDRGIGTQGRPQLWVPDRPRVSRKAPWTS